MEIVDQAFRWRHDDPVPLLASLQATSRTLSDSCGVALLLRLAGTLPVTLPLTLAALYVAACCDCGVAGSHPLLVSPSVSIRRCSRSSVMTSRCSYADRRQSSLAEVQWIYDLLIGLCSTMAAPIFREEVGAKLITSRHRFGP